MVSDVSAGEKALPSSAGAQVFSKGEVDNFDDFFKVIATTARTQAAVMVLQYGQVSGEFGTDHPQSDQAFIVLDGVGQLVLTGGDVELREGDCGVIEAGRAHQFMGKSEQAFRTLNIYGPVAYPEEA